MITSDLLASKRLSEVTSLRALAIRLRVSVVAVGGASGVADMCLQRLVKKRRMRRKMREKVHRGAANRGRTFPPMLGDFSFRDMVSVIGSEGLDLLSFSPKLF